MKRLKLSWQISDFFPNSRGLGRVEEYTFPEGLGTIEEYIVPEDLGTVEEHIMPEDMKIIENGFNYWSVPEILLDIRWITEVAGNQNILSKEKLLETRIPYDREECQFRRLIQSLQAYANRYYTYNRKLEKIYDEKKAFIDFWNRYKQIIHNARPRRNVYAEFTAWYDSKELSNAAADLLSIARNDNLLFKNNIEQNFPNIRRLFYRMLNSAENYLDERASYEEGRIFAGQVYSFYTRYLFQAEEKEAGQNLLLLSQTIKKILTITGDEISIPRTNKWDSEYRNSIWIGLQEVTTLFCKSLTPTIESGQITYFQTPAALVAAVTKEMGVAKISDQLVEEYRKDSEKESRCIAMLAANNQHIRILSLSGFLDCEDPQLETYRKTQRGYRNNQELLAKLRTVCNLLSAKDPHLGRIELASFTPGVVNVFHYYETETSAKECFRNVLNDKSRWENIGKSKPCCERKIIAKLEACYHTTSIQSGKIIVKFAPCKRCETSLNAWDPNKKVKIIYGG